MINCGVGREVPQAVRETVEAVRKLTTTKKLPCGVQQRLLVEELGLDKSTVSRRINQAIELGYLVNLEDKKGRPARLKLDEKLPEQTDILPPAEILRTPTDQQGPEGVAELHGCVGGEGGPMPPTPTFTRKDAEHV